MNENKKIVPYSTSVGFQLDYSSLISQLLLCYNPQRVLNLAKVCVNAEGGPLIDIQATAEAFVKRNRHQEAFVIINTSNAARRLNFLIYTRTGNVNFNKRETFKVRCALFSGTLSAIRCTLHSCTLRSACIK